MPREISKTFLHIHRSSQQLLSGSEGRSSLLCHKDDFCVRFIPFAKGLLLMKFLNLTMVVLRFLKDKLMNSNLEKYLHLINKSHSPNNF